MLSHRFSAARVYLILAVWSAIASGLIGSAYALYYITRAHLDPLQLVLVGTALEASYFVCEIPTGVFADTYSRRLSVIAGLAVIGVAWIGEGLIPVFVSIVAFEIARGVGEALISGATEAWIAGEVGEADLSRLFLRETQLAQIGGFVGLPLGVALGVFDIAIPLVLGGALIVGLAIFLFAVMPEHHHPRRDATRSWRATTLTARRALRSVRVSPLLMALLGAELFWGAASEGYDRLWEAYLLTDLAFPPFGLPPIVAFGLLYLAGSVVVIATAQVARRALAPLRPEVMTRVLVAMHLARSANRALFALAPSLAVALVPFFGESILRASVGPLYRAWLIGRTDPDVRATVLSTTSVANAFGQIGGGPVSGLVGNGLGLRAAELSSAAFLVPAALFFSRAAGRARLRAEEVPETPG